MSSMAGDGQVAQDVRHLEVDEDEDEAPLERVAAIDMAKASGVAWRALACW
jgi:hypothetical protein